MTAERTDWAARPEMGGGDLFERALDDAAVGIALTGLDGRLISINSALADFFGLSTADLVDARWQDMTDPATVAEEEALLREVIEGARTSYRLLKGFTRPDGAKVWGDVIVSAVHEDDGALRCLMAQVVDVTEAVRLRQDMEASLASMIDPHALLHAVPSADGQSRDWRITWINPPAADYVGAPVSDLIGASVSALMAGPGRDAIAGWLEEAAQSGNTVAHDGVGTPSSLHDDYRWIDIRIAPVGDALSLTWRDVSERHRAMLAEQERDAQFRLLADNATDVIVRTGLDTGIEWVSPSIEDMLGWKPADMIGRRLSEFIHPDDLAASRERQRKAIESGLDEGRLTARFATADGDWRWMSDHGRLIRDDEGNAVFGVDALRDIDAEHAALSALQDREQELRGIIDTLIDPWVRLDAVRDEDGTIVDLVYVDANDAACAFNHTSREEMIGARILELLPEHGSRGTFQRYAAVIETGVPLVEDDEPFTSAFDGTVRRYDNRAVKVGDGISLTWRDVTERFEARMRLRQQAEYDPLTGVANRRHLERHLSDLLTRSLVNGSQVVVLYGDLDFFKEVNDTLGHGVGDTALTLAAQRIRSAVREGDMVARLGGDEFVIVLDRVRDVDDAKGVAQKIIAAVRRPFDVDGHRVVIGISIGIAMAATGEDPTHVLARADAALYEAKHTGRDRFVVAMPSSPAEAR